MVEITTIQESVCSDQRNQKLAFRYYGSFKVLEVVGKVAHSIQLPTDAKVHNIFHVSQMKAYHGEPLIMIQMPE